MTSGARAGALVCAAVLLGGCATHKPDTLAERLVHGSPTAPKPAHDAKAAHEAKPAPKAKPADGAQTDPAPDQPLSLSDFIARVRALTAAARPPKAAIPTLEDQRPDLLAARAMVTVSPTADHHRLLAQAYGRAGVLDAAYDQFTAAIRLEPKSASAYDGRARVWRDWGFPHLGLSDAYRAIDFAPSSPVTWNTLGTLLLKMGLLPDARAKFERALRLNPHASYALNNLCYVSLLQGDAPNAVDACRRALREQPDMRVARSNLARAERSVGASVDGTP